jgi:hypothetical protein
MTCIQKERDEKGRVSYRLVTKDEGEVIFSPESMADFLLYKMQQESDEAEET